MNNSKNYFNSDDEPIANMLNALQGQVDSTLDKFVGMIPGSEQVTGQARQSIQNTLQALRNTLQQMISNNNQPVNLQMPEIDDMSTMPRSGMITRSDMDQTRRS
jgi:hypothetical protein